MPEPKLDQLEVRATALGYATQIMVKNITGVHTEEQLAGRVIDLAKRYETYIWGRFKPNENPPTPLSTIAEAAEATSARLNELIENTADEALKAELQLAQDTWERFKADIIHKLGPRYS